MNQAAAIDVDIDTAPQGEASVIVIGNGPVGMHFANRLKQQSPATPIKVFGRENWTPYDRVGLSSFLAGKSSLEQLQRTSRAEEGIEQFIGRSIELIDRDARLVMDQLGEWHRYSTLFIATGSVPHVPQIPGRELSGVFRFRDMADAQGLMARRARSRHTVVIGGGLLGIEAARAMVSRATQVTLIQHSDRLMNRQLDHEAARQVQERLADSKVQVLLGERVHAINGNLRVSSVQLNNQQLLPCDTVIFATGISPNTTLAASCGLKVADGIRIDEQARTTDPHIFAGGECAQFGDEVFGLVAPGLEQAAVAAATVAGDEATYKGSIGATRLKVLDLACFSAGQVSDAWQYRVDRSPSWKSAEDGSYRRLYLHRGRLMGALGVGSWPEQARLQTAIQQRDLVWPWQLLRFRRHGNLWSDGNDEQVATWPATATVCQCRQVSRGELSQAIEGGCCSTEALCQATGAGTVCGSCTPLLDSLCGADSSTDTSPATRLTVFSAIAAAVAALAVWLAPMGYASSVEQLGALETLWRTDLWRQVSGYTLLGLSVFAAILSLRKRIARLSFGNYQTWRLVHLGLGIVALLTLAAHTGFRPGSGSNLLLMGSFAGVILAGILAGLMTGRGERTLRSGHRAQARTLQWLHIIALWPLPALLAVHILKAYYF